MCLGIRTRAKRRSTHRRKKTAGPRSTRMLGCGAPPVAASRGPGSGRFCISSGITLDVGRGVLFLPDSKTGKKAIVLKRSRAGRCWTGLNGLAPMSSPARVRARMTRSHERTSNGRGPLCDVAPALKGCAFTISATPMRVSARGVVWGLPIIRASS